MILSSCHIKGRYLVPIYETTDPEMLRWDYRGLLDEIEPGGKAPYLEGPMLVKDGPRWAIIGTPVAGGACRYYSGALDLERMRFEAHREGILSYGAGSGEPMPRGGSDRGMIPGSVYRDPEGRSIMLGWQSAFEGGRGWYGCTCLPRVLAIGADGRPRQTPAPELRVLRGKHAGIEDAMLENSSRFLPAGGDLLEIRATFEPRDAGEFGLRVRRSPDGSRAVEIRSDGVSLNVAGTKAPLEQDRNRDTLTLHVFLDKSVMEVFVNDGRPCVTRVIDAEPDDVGIEAFAVGGAAVLKRVDVWQMEPVWDD